MAGVSKFHSRSTANPAPNLLDTRFFRKSYQRRCAYPSFILRPPEIFSQKLDEYSHLRGKIEPLGIDRVDVRWRERPVGQSLRVPKSRPASSPRGSAVFRPSIAGLTCFRWQRRSSTRSRSHAWPRVCIARPHRGRRAATRVAANGRIPGARIAPRGLARRPARTAVTARDEASYSVLDFSFSSSLSFKAFLGTILFSSKYTRVIFDQ